MKNFFTSGRYCLLYWPEENCYSEVLESKLIEPKEATIGVVAKVKQGGKIYSGNIVAVGMRADIEQQWKELEGGEGGDEDLETATTHKTQDQGTQCKQIYRVNAYYMSCNYDSM